MAPTSVTITLDRPRVIRWTPRAEARNSSLDRPVGFGDVVKRKRGLYAICAFLWAGLVDRDHDFKEPEDLAEYLKTDEQQSAAFKALTAMLVEAGVLVSPEAQKKTNELSANSPTGPSTSSSAASPTVSTPGI